MFGLLNVVFRPLGGFISDFIYRKTHSVWAKKLWLVFLGIMMGVFELAIGFTNPHRKSTMFGLVAGFAFFLEACNGANFSMFPLQSAVKANHATGVVPHVHPFANGILSGMVGGTGNLGGIIFAIIFRYNGVHYNKVVWIIGIISIGVNCAVGWIPPIPKGQIGGR
jgi:NNP family nitrate/nitrite transporter-like MFS transporter